MALTWNAVWTNGYEAANWPQSYRENNAEIIASFFRSEGWTIDAICAMLGNMQAESYLNPAQWQHGFQIYAQNAGYGLVQWTPYSKFSNWAGSDWKTNYNKELYRIQLELDADYQGIPLQWSQTGSYPISFYNWSRSTINDYSLDWLTEAFFWNYERGTWSSVRNQYAANWYQYFQGTPPTPWDPPGPGPVPGPGPGGRYLPIWLFFKIKEANQ